MSLSATQIDNLTNRIADTLQQDGAVGDVEGNEVPSPVLAGDDSKGWPSLPDAAAYHGLAGDIVRAIEPHTEADPVALLVQTLTGFGSIVGKDSHYEVEGAQHPARLNAILVGVSSKGRKGTSWRQVKQFLRAADEQWAEDRVVEGLSSGEGLIWAVRDSIEREEPIREGGKRTGPVTGYEMVTDDPGISDKRLLVMEGEFASVLRALGREGNTLSPVLRRAWDDGDLRTLVKNSPAKATGAHISIVGHITRDELMRYLDSTEQGNGFANRFLWFVVRRSKVLPEGGGTVEVGDLHSRLGEAVEFARREGRVLRFDDRARQMWYAVYPKLSEGKPGLLGALTGRAEAYVMRLAVAYALLDSCSQIRRAHLEAALALWEYSEQSASWIFGTAIGDPVADRIVKALRTVPDHGLTRKQLGDLFSRHTRSEQITRSLALLSNRGEVTVETIKTRGRPVQIVRLAGRDKRSMRGMVEENAHSALSARAKEV